MGISRANLFLFVVTTSSYLLYKYAPELDIEPEGYSPQLLKFEGPLAVNQDLNRCQIFMDNLPGPESLAYKDGLIYTSLADGRIVSIEDEKILKTVVNTKGRPLGLRFYKEDLYVADADMGLLKVDVKTGKVSVLVPMGEMINGKPLTFLNDLDVVDGDIYFSEVTTKWNSTSLWFGFLEHSGTGRVLKYNIATGKAEGVLDNLLYGNGVQATPDKKSILVAEFASHRILRHYISGPKKGQTELFVQLPGEPDNIRRSSGGGYWIPVIAGRDISSPTWLDKLAPYPRVVKALCKLSLALGTGLEWANQYIASRALEAISLEIKTGHWFLSLLSMDHPILIELSAEGEILRSFHSNMEKFGKISQALELNGHLILGSFEHPYLLKFKL